MIAKYKTHTVTLLLGIILMIASYTFDLSFHALSITMIFKTAAGVLFIISMLYYSKILITLRKVTDIKLMQVWGSIITHTVTLTALYLWNYRPIFFVLFMGSMILRNITGIVPIDRQMKSLCRELDLRLFDLGHELY